MPSTRQLLTQLIEQSITKRENGDYLGAAHTLDQARQLASTDVALHLALATTYIELEKFEQALQPLDEALALAPRRAEVLEARAVALRELGKLDEAESVLREALTCSPEDETRVLIALAEVLDIQGDHADTIEVYKRLCQLDPGPRNYRLLGDAYLRAKRYEDAKDAYIEGLKLSESDPYLHLGRGIAEGHLGDNRRALRAIQQAARLLPGDSEIQFNLGIALEKVGENEAAIQAFQRATQLNPESGSYYSFLGTALMNAGHPEEAISAFEQAVKLNPNDLDTQLLLQLALLTHGERDIALTNTRHLVEKYPESARVRSVLGFMLVAEGRYDEALTQLDEALQLAPDRPEFYINKAFVLRLLGRSEEALATVRCATEIAADDPMAWYSAGMAYMSVEQYEEAIEAFETATQVQRDFMEGHIGLSMALIQLGEHEQAEEVLKYAVQRVDPDNLIANLNLALVYTMTGEVEKAKRYTNIALRRFSDKADAHILRGQIFMSAGNYQLAEESFRKAVELEPGNANAKFALALPLMYRAHYWEAASLLKQAIVLVPTFVLAYAYLAYVMEMLTCFEEATVFAQTAVASDSQSPVCLFILAAILADLEQCDEALEFHQQALTLAPNHPMADRVQIMILTRSGNYEEAIATTQRVQLVKSSTRAKEKATLINALGFIYLLQDNLDQAIQHFEKAAQLDVQDAMFVYNLGVAYFIRGEIARAIEEYKRAIELDRQTQFSTIRYHLWELSRYTNKKPTAASLIEPAINLLHGVCERGNIGTCPDISDVIELVGDLQGSSEASMDENP
jgi:tetratricopeptide (TPR) repeat protein